MPLCDVVSWPAPDSGKTHHSLLGKAPVGARGCGGNPLAAHQMLVLQCQCNLKSVVAQVIKQHPRIPKAYVNDRDIKKSNLPTSVNLTHERLRIVILITKGSVDL